MFTFIIKKENNSPDIFCKSNPEREHKFIYFNLSWEVAGGEQYDELELNNVTKNTDGINGFVVNFRILGKSTAIKLSQPENNG